MRDASSDTRDCNALRPTLDAAQAATRPRTPARGAGRNPPGRPGAHRPDTRRRLPPPVHAAPEAEARDETADALAVIARRARQQRTCRECGHVRDGALRGRCPACGTPVPGLGVDP